MLNAISRFSLGLALVAVALTLSACGYNTIPTLEEQAKARWSDVQNQYQRRADLIPNLVSTVQGYAAQEKNVLTSVIEARAKATQVKIDASDLTDPAKIKAFSRRTKPTYRGARPIIGSQREVSRSQIQRKFSGPAVSTRKYREQHRDNAPRLYRCGARL